MIKFKSQFVQFLAQLLIRVIQAFDHGLLLQDFCAISLDLFHLVFSVLYHLFRSTDALLLAAFTLLFGARRTLWSGCNSRAFARMLLPGTVVARFGIGFPHIGAPGNSPCCYGLATDLAFLIVLKEVVEWKR